jgi:hypothetical protein
MFNPIAITRDAVRLLDRPNRDDGPFTPDQYEM